MNDSRLVFEHTDEDGDELRVTSWMAGTGRGDETGPNLLLRARRGGDAGDDAAVRLYRDQVKELATVLIRWLESGSGSETTGEPAQREGRRSVQSPQPTVRPPAPKVAPEFLRRAALNAAVAYAQYASQTQHIDVLGVAAKFEDYLRFGKDPWSEPEPEPQITGVCPECEHPLNRHGASGCRVGHPESATGWRNDNACRCRVGHPEPEPQITGACPECDHAHLPNTHTCGAMMGPGRQCECKSGAVS